MLLLIDNYDSFTWNLAQMIGAIGADVRVVRNDRIDLHAVEAAEPEAIVISPGPGRPEDAGISMAVVTQYSGRIPILGVCLGHQAIAAACGARVVRAPQVMHGKVSRVRHAGAALFAGVPSPFMATRYHSLMVDEATFPDALEVIAWTDEEDGAVIQGLKHREHETWGVQFHPESVSTEVGPTILRNLLERARCV